MLKLFAKEEIETEAIQRTLRSLDEFVLEGITTTIELHKKILRHKKFIESQNLTLIGLGKEKFIRYYNLVVVNHKLHGQKE